MFPDDGEQVKQNEDHPSLSHAPEQNKCCQWSNSDFLYIKEYHTFSTPLVTMLKILQSEKNIFGMFIPSQVSPKIKLQVTHQETWMYARLSLRTM